MYDAYAARGVTFILAVGQGKQGEPSTQQIAKVYKLEHGYQDGWHALADPDWQKISSIVKPTSDGIPNHIILDKDLILRYSSSSSDFPSLAETKLIQLLNAQGL